MNFKKINPIFQNHKKQETNKSRIISNIPNQPKRTVFTQKSKK